MSRRSPLAAAVGLLVVLAPAGVVGADPPGPTDFETTVLGVEPATPSIQVAIIGGDSFVQLTVERGTEVLVPGYGGEPYVRFNSDGTVEENRQSPTWARNQDRYGDAPSEAADPAGAPEWSLVATSGTYAWHDHRAHWMSRQSPPGFERGDRIQDGTIALQVNGAPVTISVTTTWLDKPSHVAMAAGAIVAGFALMIVLSMRRRVAWVLVVAGAAAAGIGWWQVNSVPADTAPSMMWWLLPAVGGAFGVIAVVLGRSLASYALALVGSIELALWVFMRRQGFTKAFLPTDAPFWLDRGVSSAAGVISVIVIVTSAVALVRMEIPDPSRA